MKKNLLFITALILILAIACTGCSKASPGSTDDKKPSENTKNSDVLHQQSQLKESKKLSLSEDGNLTVEIDTLAKPDSIAPEDKPIFLAVKVKEDADIALRYTYDTYGKEGVMLCCDVNDSDENEVLLKPIYTMRLAQSSEENYGEIWLGGGTFLKKGTNLFYLSAGDQTLPCRIILKLTFFDPDKVESITLYPAES